MNAIFGFSFGGSQKYGPGAANRALGRRIDEVAYKYPKDFVVVQSPLEQCVTIAPDFVIPLEKYINSEEVIKRALDIFQENDLGKIRLVAHPFLHRIQCMRLLRRYGFDVEIVPTGWVPFDQHSDGWWTRGPLRLIAYAILTLFGLHGLGYRESAQ
ncbi:hypothetical protein A3I42_03115 [Candidatus Uhrbacteria bacterium RIFCSPLOWO2_02_FULL_49_11]|uniref:DUF218 domain-containing protein n=1 Tax=Candidatus Uhrbacteria bacterium RIFCSPLOWO2_02_FULL_49_11 TaxID=1802409 RepID=A0A1F7VCX4_9BACT|nr:MAG: hypothetical protein A3I42_03115 [Candidatus Uhrbacteria bacterium RIFCSPLOWO2_02_FULL_49_11]